MMILGMGYVCDRIYKGHRAVIIRKRKGPLHPCVTDLPIGEPSRNLRLLVGSQSIIRS